MIIDPIQVGAPKKVENGGKSKLEPR
jgi:hypothetical protein